MTVPQFSEIRSIHTYTTLVFDCDGVVLDSNRIKTEAFRAAALPWGEAAADALVSYHVAHGGISRYAKFGRFIEHILPEHTLGRIPGSDGPGLKELLAAYAQTVRAGLMTCTVATGLEDLRAATPHARWLIVSGGDQAELREIFSARGLAGYFDGGIFGSPDSKDIILTREKACGNIAEPSLFLGDSRYDLEAARRADLDFLFVSGWTEVTGWREFVQQNGVRHVERLADLGPIPSIEYRRKTT